MVAVLAFVTDLFDGYLARRWGVVSHFGICFDPVADKIFMLSAFSALVSHPKLGLSVFPLILIIVREILVSGLRVILLVAKTGLLPAQRFGKLKSSLQFGFIFAASLFLWARSFNWTFDLRFDLIFWAVSLFTLVSGLPYFWQHRAALAQAWTSR